MKGLSGSGTQETLQRRSGMERSQVPKRWHMIATIQRPLQLQLITLRNQAQQVSLLVPSPEVGSVGCPRLKLKNPSPHLAEADMRSQGDRWMGLVGMQALR